VKRLSSPMNNIFMSDRNAYFTSPRCKRGLLKGHYFKDRILIFLVVIVVNFPNKLVPLLSRRSNNADIIDSAS